MDNHCTTCHFGKSPSAGFALSSYDEVRLQTEKGSLLKRINDNLHPMPQSGLMAKSLRKTIAKWADQGYPKLESKAEKSLEEYSFTPPPILPINLNEEGFDFFNLMKGHWVGNMNLMGQKFEWFSFDYRPISPSHIHGIYEAGSMGNLFTSFFIADYKGTKTIMARNGGLLNGIYRTSYFVLDQVKISPSKQYFRLVDAYGGAEIMYMDLTFSKDGLHFKSYTSKFGLTGKPKLHMDFRAKRHHLNISENVAQLLKYPQNIVDVDFSEGLPIPKWNTYSGSITSASFIYQDSGNLKLEQLAELSGDPITVQDMPYLSTLDINISLNTSLKKHKLILYLSREPLTEPSGKIILEKSYIKKELFDGVLAFPELEPGQSDFSFTYLHPGKYYLTAVFDKNEDGYISTSDYTSKGYSIVVRPEQVHRLDVPDTFYEN